MKRAKDIALLVLLAAATALLIEAALLTSEARAEVREVSGTMQGVLLNANSAVDRASDVEAKLELAADTQTAYWEKTQLQVYKLVTDSKEIMVRTDRSLNDVLVPRLAASLDASVALQRGAAGDLERTTTELEPVLANFALASAGAAAAMNDPQLKESQANFAVASTQLAAATTDAAASMSKVRAGVDYEVDALMKPVKKVKVVGEELVRLAGRFLGY